jgi:glycosyltransferase involved in cell wall biosynthesis
MKESSPKKLKILHLEASPGWGGQEMRILKEAEGMRLRSHEVILGVMKKGKLVQAAKEAGFRVYELNFYKTHWIFSLIKLIWLIKKHRIDIVNTHSSLDSWIGGIAARICGVFVVRTRHLSTPIKKGLNSLFLYGKLADRVVTTCSSILPMIIEQSKKPSSLCSSIPTGVETRKIQVDPEKKKQFRESLGLNEDHFLVGTACFMRSWKGILDLLQAADHLRNQKEIRWVIIGGGHEALYRAKAKEWNLDGIVFFTGHLKDPFAAMDALDIFTLLSTAHEGVSQSILQAGFLEKPLIATPVGGLQEVCIHEKTGLLVNPFSPKEVALSVMHLKENKEKRLLFGKKAKQLVTEHFLIEHTLNQMENLYLSLWSSASQKLKRKISVG